MYTYEKKVLFSDIDAKATMSLYGILNALQDCVNVNSESIGRGIDYMMEKRRSWFAISWNIEIKRYPKMFEDIVIKTWPYDFSAIMGFRNVIIEDRDGNVMICADSIWSLVDLNTGRPARINEEDRHGYDPEPRFPMKEVPRKIAIPSETAPQEAYCVSKSDIDYNGHMSNAEYIRMADEFLKMGVKPKQIRVEYKNQSQYKEILIPYVSRKPECVVVCIKGKEKDDIKAVVEFRL